MYSRYKHIYKKKNIHSQKFCLCLIFFRLQSNITFMHQEQTTDGNNYDDTPIP